MPALFANTSRVGKGRSMTIKNARMELVSDDRYLSFMGAVNKLFSRLDRDGFVYSVQYGVNGEQYCAFVTYWEA